jgi:hypothetical protein
MGGKGQPAFWMGAKGTLASAHRNAPFGSWWTNVERQGWGNAVHARWHGPKSQEAKKSTPKLALLRRQSKPPKPRGR